MFCLIIERISLQRDHLLLLLFRGQAECVVHWCWLEPQVLPLIKVFIVSFCWTTKGLPGCRNQARVFIFLLHTCFLSHVCCTACRFTHFFVASCSSALATFILILVCFFCAVLPLSISFMRSSTSFWSAWTVGGMTGSCSLSYKWIIQW